jgi:hypothetical protein
MGQKEILRVKVLEMVKEGKQTLKAASVTLRISHRHATLL